MASKPTVPKRADGESPREQQSDLTLLHRARAVSLQILLPVKMEDSVVFRAYSLKPALF